MSGREKDRPVRLKLRQFRMLASFAYDIVAFLWFVMTSIFLSLPASQVSFASQRQKKNGMSWSTDGSQAQSGSDSQYALVLPSKQDLLFPKKLASFMLN